MLVRRRLGRPGILLVWLCLAAWLGMGWPVGLARLVWTAGVG